MNNALIFKKNKVDGTHNNYLVCYSLLELAVKVSIEEIEIGLGPLS